MLIFFKYGIYALLSFLMGWWAHSGLYVWKRSNPTTWARRSPSWGCGAILFIIPLILLGRYLVQTESRELVALVGFGSTLLGFVYNSSPIRALRSGGVIDTKKYRNKQWNFEITLLPNWHEATFTQNLKSFPQIPSTDQLSNPEFYDPNGSSIKFAIGPISPVPSIDQQKMNLQQVAEKYDHNVLSLGEIEVNGKRHATMTCEIPSIGIVKNYSLIFTSIEYFVTGSGNLTDCDAIVQSFTIQDSRNKAKQSFDLFCKAKAIYEQYLKEHGVDLDNSTQLQRQEAREDTSLAEAERLYIEARTLSEERESLPNVAVACHQLGMLYYLQNKQEAENALSQAIAIIKNLPQPGHGEKEVASSCHHYLGLIALEQKDKIRARHEFQTSLEIDIAIHDLRGASVARQALKRCEDDEQL